LKKKRRRTTKNQKHRSKAKRKLKNTKQNFNGSKLRHEQLKRRKEGEEKAHEDGGMVG